MRLGKTINNVGLRLRQAIAADAIEATASGLDTSAQRARRRAAIRLSVGLGLVLLVVYAASPIRTSSDSRWSIHTAMSLLRGNAGDLTEYLPVLERHDFYAIVYCEGRPRTVFPVGVSLLAAPAVAVAALVDPGFNERLRTGIPEKFEQVVASVFGALVGVIFFWLVFSRLRSVPVALASTAILCFSTSMWSTATRALWQHGPFALMLVIAMLLLVRARQRETLVQFVSVPLALAFIIRPTAAIPIAVISAYVLFRHRAMFVRYVLLAAAIAVPWFAYNYSVCATLLPVYYLPGRLGTETFAEALLGHLVSPARGLFIYSPVLVFALGGFALALRDRADRPLHISFGLIVILHWLVVSWSADWWGGHSFGPRYMTDILPILAFFVALNLRVQDTAGALRWRALCASIGLLAAVGFVIHARAAFRMEPHVWNITPTTIQKDPSRLWDWHDPPFLRG